MVFGSGLCWSESLIGVFGFWWGLQGFFWSLPSLSLWAEGRDFWFSSWGLSYSSDLSCLFGAMGGLRCVFWGLRSSEPRGWLFVCFSCVFGYSIVA